MPNLNKVQLMGNLTRDPEIKYTPKGLAITQIGLAINRFWSNEAGEKQEEVTFVNVDFLGRKAEVIAEYCKKGDPIYIEGRLKLDSWDDKASGQKRHALKVVGESFEFLKQAPSRRDSTHDEEEPDPRQKQNTRAQSAQRPPPKAPPRPPVDPDLDAAEDDIPFRSIDKPGNPFLLLANLILKWLNTINGKTMLQMRNSKAAYGLL